MCGRFTLIKPKLVKKRFHTVNDIPLFEPTYNVAPSQFFPVVTKNSPNKINLMRWGYIPEWGKEKGISLINIRSESTKEKPYFRNVLSTRRCIIPSTGFFEWKKEGNSKTPYFIYLKGKKLFGFAGVYSNLKDAEGKEVNTFAILTCPANEFMKGIHERMPVILGEKDEELWLDEESKVDKLEKLLTPYEGEMEGYPISKLVNSPENDGEKIIEKMK